MTDRYRDKPASASDGKMFERLCIDTLLPMIGETQTLNEDQHSQIHVGDTAGGYEFKELLNARDRLHIEVAERKNLDGAWVPSGVHCSRRRYMCGSHREVFLFSVPALRRWIRATEPEEVWYGRNEATGHAPSWEAETATIRSALLLRDDATKLCLYRFEFTGEWLAERTPHGSPSVAWAGQAIKVGKAPEFVMGIWP